MLVLTRKTEQKIRIGKDVVITILKVHGDQVSVGIEAPKELQIVREELLQPERAGAYHASRHLVPSGSTEEG